MGTNGTTDARTNALKREFALDLTHSCTAPPEAVYDLLADLESHLIWGGDRQGKKTRLRSITAPDAPAVVGTEFSSEGLDPSGAFDDHSVVTDATPPRLFAFVTEATLRTRKGKTAEWTNVHRYEIEPTATGCTVHYTFRVTRLSAVPGQLALFNIPVIHGAIRRIAGMVADKGFKNLIAMAEANGT